MKRIKATIGLKNPVPPATFAAVSDAFTKLMFYEFDKHREEQRKKQHELCAALVAITDQNEYSRADDIPLKQALEVVNTPLKPSDDDDDDDDDGEEVVDYTNLYLADVRQSVIEARVALHLWEPKEYRLALLVRAAQAAIREFLIATEVNGEPPIVEYYNENRCFRVKTNADDRKWLEEMHVAPFGRISASAA